MNALITIFTYSHQSVQFPSYCPSLQSRHRDIMISLLSPLAILSIDTQPNILGTSYSTIRAIRHFHHFSSDLIFRYGIYFLLSSVPILPYPQRPSLSKPFIHSFVTYLFPPPRPRPPPLSSCPPIPVPHAQIGWYFSPL